MSNENETVAQVCDWLTERDLPFAASIAMVKIANPHYDAEACMIGALKNLADLILSAHNREIGELKGDRKGLIKANESLAADNDRLREENASLRALVKEMLSHIEELYQCQSPCDSRCLRKKESCEFRARRELIVKAREAVNG